MNADHPTYIRLQLTAQPSLTLLPRCLQVLSRRGCLLQELTTHELPAGQVRLDLTIDAPLRWHASLAGLLSKLPDVTKVVKA